MPRYEPLPPPDPNELDNRRLLEYMQQEFQRIAGVVAEVDQGRRDVVYVEPVKPRDGQLVYADGVTWNPGSSVGLYYRKSTDWVFAGNVGNLTNINVSAGTTSNNLSKVTFSDSNGVSFGLSNSVVTASVRTDYLTTAMASNRGSDFVQATAAFAGTNASGTIASSGISVSVGAGGSPNFSAGTTSNNLGSVVFSNANGVSFGLDGSTITGSISGGVGGYPEFSAGTQRLALDLIKFADSNGISFGLNGSTLTATVGTNYLTTAALSNHSHGNPQLNLTNLSGTTASNSAGFTLSLSAGNYLTTARASNDAVGLNTAQTNVTWTVNSSGISLNAGAYLTTAMASNAGSNFAGLGETTGTTAGTDLKMTVDSAGVNISFPKWITTAAASDHSHGNPTLALTNLTGTTASASNGFTLSLSAAAPGGGAAPTIYDWANMAPNVSVMNVSNMTAMSQQPFFFPMFIPGNLTWNRGYINVSRSTSGSNAFTLQFALYTFVNSTQISRLASLQNVFSNTATASVSGLRNLEFSGIETAGSSLTPGHYIGMLYFSAANTASMNYSVRGHSTINPPVGIVGAGSNNVTTATSALSSIATRMFAGRYTTTTASPPATVATDALRMFTTGWDPYLALGAR